MPIESRGENIKLVSTAAKRKIAEIHNFLFKIKNH